MVFHILPLSIFHSHSSCVQIISYFCYCFCYFLFSIGRFFSMKNNKTNLWMNFVFILFLFCVLFHGWMNEICSVFSTQTYDLQTYQLLIWDADSCDKRLITESKWGLFWSISISAPGPFSIKLISNWQTFHTNIIMFIIHDFLFTTI